MTPQELIQLAVEARRQSYCPYSGFAVGAAVLAEDGLVFAGCNVENAAFSPTLCAERVAVGKAVSEGVRRIVAVAVVGGKQSAPYTHCPPCGVCRQVLREFCADGIPVYLGRSDGGFDTYTLAQLLPVSFSPAALEEG